MELIDTHSHIYMPEFADDGTPAGLDALRRAVDAGVAHVVLPAVDVGSFAALLALHGASGGRTSVAVGLHPTESRDDWCEQLDSIVAMATEAGITPVAVGETGIDLYWDREYEERQMASFDRQCSLAAEWGVPVIIHCREGLYRTLEVLTGHPGVKTLFHSFGGDDADVERIRAVTDAVFGINGIVTFKNCHVRDTLPAIGVDRLVLETDSPYLAPVPRRGKRNESALLPYIAAEVARSLGMETDEAAAVTTANAKVLFGLS